LVEQLEAIERWADEHGEDFARLAISYQVTMNIGDSEHDARRAFGEYISKYYPELSRAIDLSNWGPVGTPEQIADWIRTFADAGVDHFICRFGAIDQFAQVERFAKEVLPVFARGGNRRFPHGPPSLQPDATSRDVAPPGQARLRRETTTSG